MSEQALLQDSHSDPRNEEDYDTWEYGTEPLPGDTTWNYEFEHHWGGERTQLQKIKGWISKQKPPLNTILKYLFSYVEKWYWDGKVQQTMSGVDRQIDELQETWDEQKTMEEEYTTEPSEVEGLDTISVKYNWPGPDQWYKGPLEVFEELEGRPKKTRD